MGRKEEKGRGRGKQKAHLGIYFQDVVLLPAVLLRTLSLPYFVLVRFLLQPEKRKKSRKGCERKGN